MAERAVNELMEGAMEKIRSMVDSNTVVGTPITTHDGATLIPISRLSFGFASGGSDKTGFASGGNDKSESPAKPGIWGGGGAAVKVEPVGFLLGKDGGARMLSIQPPAFSPADRLIDMAPEIMDKIEGYIDKYGKMNG